MTQPITISTLNAHIAQILEGDDLLRDLWIIGEVSNWKQAASGHIYFSLKDSGAAIAAVMWRNSARGHNWLPTNGDQIIAHGYVGVYPERGVYQLYVNRIQPAGRGQLYARFEALKERLSTEGLFDPERKRPLHLQPRRIGIVTSANAAALRDVLKVLATRWPLIDVVLFPTLVQGSDAPPQIVQAIATANQYDATVEQLDTLILARGGGSIEDLWAFNDEQLAYAIAQSTIPIVVGVGHETDFTIADFVADLRAPTPSAAAAAVVPDLAETRERLVGLHHHLVEQATNLLFQEGSNLSQLAARLHRITPIRQLDQRRQRLTDRTDRLHEIVTRRLASLRQQNDAALAQLQILNPQSILERGYSIVLRKDGTVVTEPSKILSGEQLQIRAAGGEYLVTRD